MCRWFDSAPGHQGLPCKEANPCGWLFCFRVQTVLVSGPFPGYCFFRKLPPLLPLPMSSPEGLCSPVDISLWHYRSTATDQTCSTCRCAGCASQKHRRVERKKRWMRTRLTGTLRQTQQKTCPKDRKWTESPASGLDGKRRCWAMSEAAARTMPNAACPKATLRQGLLRRGSKKYISKSSERL